MRTDVATISNRPKFKHNLFTFQKIIDNQNVFFKAALNNDHPISRDLKGKFLRYGSLSLAQEKLLYDLYNNVQKPRENA